MQQGKKIRMGRANWADGACTKLQVVLAVAALTGLCTTTAQAAFIQLHADLSGPAEAPPNGSPGTGLAFVELDTVAHTLRVGATFSDLLGTTIAAHIHCCTADPFAGAGGVATMTPSFIGFPLGVTAGSFDGFYDTQLPTTWNPAFITANGGAPLSAEAALFTGLSSGKAYFNIHSTVFTAGEIRGFFVPEPTTLALFGLGLAGIGAIRRKKAAPESSGDVLAAQRTGRC